MEKAVSSLRSLDEIDPNEKKFTSPIWQACEYPYNPYIYNLYLTSVIFEGREGIFATRISRHTSRLRAVFRL